MPSALEPGEVIRPVDDWTCQQYVNEIAAILARDLDEYDMADALREYAAVNLESDVDLYCAVLLRCKVTGVINSYRWGKFFALERPEPLLFRCYVH